MQTTIQGLLFLRLKNYMMNMVILEKILEQNRSLEVTIILHLTISFIISQESI
jgi:hypothetical protein